MWSEIWNSRIESIKGGLKGFLEARKVVYNIALYFFSLRCITTHHKYLTETRHKLPRITRLQFNRLHHSTTKHTSPDHIKHRHLTLDHITNGTFTLQPSLVCKDVSQARESAHKEFSSNVSAMALWLEPDLETIYCNRSDSETGVLELRF